MRNSTPPATSHNETRRFQILIVESNPADTLLTMAAFKAAGLKSGLRCVSDGADALRYVRREGRYVKAPIPDLIFLDLSHPKNRWSRSLEGDQNDAAVDARSDCGGGRII